ncbi:ACP S-malonyltransferase [Salisediminibacterium beveridgei]|uniref:Malonyl CoA-acyl carrier protein transacylase n=1 Tax=Salisediminibacterium beveridgei TaxID=632773 RepID=A0A1D7QW38_9BACI|nr:ACP S-malonyltransferase [Salisediminibacterium beveridgei]AOM83222.1 Malonyl CoA-acyl carrier protein transacylase [Salisediminibacterium beveridgei]
MTKIAVMFPGQGSQSPGMGHELFLAHAAASNVFEEADKALERSLSSLIFEGDAEELKKTTNTQPALFTTGAAVWKVLEDHGIQADYACGHSLGEYTALYASGALSFNDAVKLVQTRGKLMEEAVPDGQGAMAAIMGLPKEAVLDISNEVHQLNETAEPANYNAEGQIVISGTSKGVEKACELAKDAGARRVIPLNVSGPFHSSLMMPASEQMQNVLDHVAVHTMAIPVIANVTASPYRSTDEVKQLLVDQIHSPVKWTETIQYLIDQGVDTFIEAGPGKVLAGLVKKAARRATVLPVYDDETLEKALNTLKAEK